MNNRTYTVKITGTGAAITKYPGFTPAAVKVMNASGKCTLEWNNAMANAAGYKILTGIDASADTVSKHSFITSGGITPVVGGFTVGADTDINVNGEDLYITAWE